MATRFALITWAGLGNTVTFTDAGDIVNFTAHGAPNGHAFRFTGTGTPPTSFTKDTVTYYLRQGADADKFTVHPTSADAIAGTNQITFAGTGSGTNQVVGEYWATLGAMDRARYGTPGSEYVYKGYSAALTAMALAANRDITTDLVCEIQGKWVDLTYNSGELFNGYKSATLTTTINGVRSDAFHGGVVGAGYVYKIARATNSNIVLSHPNITIDGLDIQNTAALAGYGGIAASLTTVNSTIKNCLIKSSTGIKFYGSNTKIFNNVIYDCSGEGINEAPVPVGAIIAFNIIKNCANGILGGTSSGPSWSAYIGNIITGCTTRNWPIKNSTNINNGRFQAWYNFGDAAVDIRTVTFSAATNTVNFISHGHTLNTPILFKSEAGAIMPAGLLADTWYYTRTVTDANAFTLTTAPAGAADIDFTTDGSGAITYSLVWDTTNTAKYLTTADFTDYVNNDFRPASGTSPHVEIVPISDGDGLPRYDLLDAVRPNYEASSYPDNKATAGPFEFDHDNGLAPTTVTISITGMISGSILAIYKTSDMSEIAAPASTTGSYSASYAYTGDTTIIVRVRKGTSVGKYLPYEYAGTITSVGFSLNVSQILDPIA